MEKQDGPGVPQGSQDQIASPELDNEVRGTMHNMPPLAVFRTDPIEMGLVEEVSKLLSL